jgi:hypothetical protein
LFDFGVIDPAQRRLNKAGSPPPFPIIIVAVVGTIGTQLNGTYSSVSTQLK